LTPNYEAILYQLLASLIVLANLPHEFFLLDLDAPFIGEGVFDVLVTKNLSAAMGQHS
jgi:hypothetical protein